MDRQFGGRPSAAVRSERSIRSMFTKKMDIFCPVDLTRNSMLTAIIKITLKVRRLCLFAY